MSQYQPYPVAAQSQWAPIYEVRVVKHTGMVIAWWQQTYTVRGSYDQCLRAIREAQNMNLLLGWWSILSLVLFNWVAIFQNVAALVAHKRQVQAVQAYWASHPSQGQQRSASGAEYRPPQA